MTIVVGILFFGLAIHSKSDESTINQITGKVVDTMNSEIAKTKDYQKAQWHQGKEQIDELVSKVKKVPPNINEVADAITTYFSIWGTSVDEKSEQVWNQFENDYNNIKIESHYTVKGWKEQAKDFWLDLQGKKEEKMAEAKEFLNSF